MDPLFILSVFIAGIVMFLAPCTLPLIPAYLGYISGVTEEEMVHPETRVRARRIVFMNSLGFVAGFSAVFVSFGLLAGIAGSLVGELRQTLAIFGGLLLIVFGLFMLGVFHIPFLARVRRTHIPAWIRGTPASAALLGAAFAFGWTPCIGPILATVLFLAGSTETALSGALLLLVFSAGFSVPFLALAFVISQASRFVERALPYLHGVSVVGGVFLVLLGVFLVSGNGAIMSSFGGLLEKLDYEHALMRYI